MTYPLTCKHLSIIFVLSLDSIPTLRRNPKTRGSPRDPTRGLNALAHPNTSPLSCRGDRPIAPLARQEGCGTSECVIPETSLPPSSRGSGTPSPHPTRVPCPLPCPPGDGKTPWIEATTDRPPPAERPSRRSACSELALYQDRGGGLASPAPDKLPVVGPSASLRHTKSSTTWGRWGTRDLRVRHVIGNSRGPPARSLAPTAPLGAWERVKARLVCPDSRSTHRALGRGRLQSAPRRTSMAPDSRITAGEWRLPAHQVRLPSPTQNSTDKPKTRNPTTE